MQELIQSLCFVILAIYVYILSSKLKQTTASLSLLKEELKRKEKAVRNYDVKQLEMAIEDMGKCRTDYEVAKIEWSKLAKVIKEADYAWHVMNRDLKDLEKYTYPNGYKPIKIKHEGNK